VLDSWTSNRGDTARPRDIVKNRKGTRPLRKKGAGYLRLFVAARFIPALLRRGTPGGLGRGLLRPVGLRRDLARMWRSVGDKLCTAAPIRATAAFRLVNFSPALLRKGFLVCRASETGSLISQVRRECPTGGDESDVDARHDEVLSEGSVPDTQERVRRDSRTARKRRQDCCRNREPSR
jgi:hypothetical protein